MTILESDTTTTANGGNGVHNTLHRRGATTLGLGWLIAITLCGGVSLFICVGFALTWRAQKRRTPMTITRTTASLPYEASGFTAMLSGKPSTTRLTKRRMAVLEEAPPGMTIGSEDEDGEKSTLGWSRELSSRFSLKRIPSVPVLPPLPSYSTFRLFNPKRASYRRERGWLEEESVGSNLAMMSHRMTASTRQRAGSGSGWAGQNPPVLPPVGQRARMQAPTYNGQQQQQQQQQLPPPPPPHQQDPKQHQQQQHTNEQEQAYQGYEQQHRRQHSNDNDEDALPAMPGAVYGGDNGAQDFVRPAAAVLARHPTRTDSELRDILRSTEQRLRDGRSRSPEKRTPHGSPSKNSALHNTTPRSLRIARSPSSHGSGGGNGRVSRQGVHYSTGSPTRHGGGISSSGSGSGSGMGMGMGPREGSATSIGSAANSLIAQATEELQLPGGMGSPSRLRGHEWLAGDDAILQLTTKFDNGDGEDKTHPLQREIAQRQYQKQLQQQQEQKQQQQQQQQQRSPQRSPQRERRRSVDSDASSSLSTLYSVGDEVDEASIEAVVEGPNDVFVERPTGDMPVLRPLRRTMTVSSDTLARHVDRDTMPSVYGPPVSSHSERPQGHQATKSLDAHRFAGALQPPTSQPQRGDEEEVRPKSMYTGGRHVHESPQISESSFTDISVDSTALSSTSASSEEDGETVMGDDDTIRISGFDMMTTPVKEDTRRRAGSDASSSPFSEHDIVNMIIAAQSPTKSKRALPAAPGLPTVMAPDGSVVPTPLSPPPKLPPKSVRRTASMAVRKTSGTSSYYGDDAELGPLSPKAPTTTAGPGSMLLGLPASRSAQTGVINGLSVCNSVAALRRMNSLVSVVSNTSLTSSVAAAEQRSELPTPNLPNLADGRLPQLQSSRKAPTMGSRQYLNVGGSHDKLSKKKSNNGRPSGPRPKTGHARSHTTTSASTTSGAAASSTTPERPAKNPRRSVGNVTSLVERYHQQQQQFAAAATAEKEQDHGKENAGLGIVRAPSRNEGQALQESRSRGSTPTKDIATAAAATQGGSPHRLGLHAPVMKKMMKNPVVAELAAAEQRRNKDKRGSVDTLGLYDKDGFLLPSPERELQKKLLRM